MALTINLTLPTFGTTPGKIPAIGSTLGASQLVVTDAQGKLSTSGVTATEAGYLAGTSGVIQTQINTKAETTIVTAIATRYTPLMIAYYGTGAAAAANTYFMVASSNLQTATAAQYITTTGTQVLTPPQLIYIARPITRLLTGLRLC